MMLLRFLWLWLLCSNTAYASFDFLRSEPQILPVEQAYQLDFKQQDNQLTLQFTMAGRQYYLYQEKFAFSAVDATIGRPTFPKATIHHDEFFGDLPVFFNRVDIALPIIEANANSSLQITYQGCLDKILCYPPTTIEVPLTAVAKNAPLTQAATPQTEQDTLAQMLAEHHVGVVIATLFGLGILLAFTPCVFPMYPILTGIIAGHGARLSSTKAFGLSMAYVQGMALTYTLLGLVVASAGARYQAILQSPAVLIGLALLFVLLSLSMFGLYQLQLPSRLQTRLNQASNQQQGGSYLGVFTMGLISGLVASPCTTAPLSGVLIYVAQSGDLLLGAAALYALSLGMGLPLLLLGTSGGKLLPKAGAWMDTIKHTFGFLLLSVSLMMLERIWAGPLLNLTWAAWALALIGYLTWRNYHSQASHWRAVRYGVLLCAAIASSGYGVQALRAPSAHQQQAVVPFTAIKSLQDLELAVAEAQAQGKHVMLDLYADWCTACKEFEHKTFPAPEVTAHTAEMVLLQADLTRMDKIDQALMERYQVLGLPTLLFFNAQGQELSHLRVTGFMNAAPFAEHLARIKAE